MDDKNVMVTPNGEELPLPPVDPIGDGIVVAEVPEKKEE